MKGQPPDTPVLTRTGWMPLSSLAVGDTVLSTDGTASSVMAVQDRGECPIVRVRLSDHTEAVCADDHHWLTRTYAERNALSQARRASNVVSRPSTTPKLRSTREIAASLR